MNSAFSVWRLPVAVVALTIALTGCEQRIDDGLELGAANADAPESYSVVTRPPVHNPDQAAFYNPDQPSAYQNYNFTSSQPPAGASSNTDSDTTSSENTDTPDTQSSPGNSPSDANSGGSSSDTDSSGRTGPAKFGQERFYGYWKIQSTEKFSDSNHIFVIAKYGEEIWHDRYNNILTSRNCFELANSSVPFQLELVQGTLGYTLETMDSDALNYTEYSYDSNQDELVRDTYRDGERYDTTRFWRLWGGTTREEMLDCER